MSEDQKNEMKRLLREMSNAAGFALQNAEAGHEKAAAKFDEQRQKAYEKLIDYLDSL
jgi:hypothetical protein